jgi:histone acetyltransferase 1
VFGLLTSNLQSGGYTTDLNEFTNHIDDPFVPPGNKLFEYTIPSLKNTKEQVTYQIYHGTFNTPGMREYHERLQFFLLFFIERMSFIDSTDPIWELLLMFERKESAKGVRYSIIGYATLYRFYAHPFQSRLRLSQIFIFPPYQREGHGGKLLHYIYEHARNYSEPILEVTIEDPAPGLRLLRDVMDVTNCKRLGYFQAHKRTAHEGKLEWNLENAQTIRDELYIPFSQIRRCYEILKLMQVDQRVTNQRATYLEEYRKEIKRRLYMENIESIATQSHSLTQRMKLLDKMYTELEQHYLLVIRKARLK